MRHVGAEGRAVAVLDHRGVEHRPRCSASVAADRRRPLPRTPRDRTSTTGGPRERRQGAPQRGSSPWWLPTRRAVRLSPGRVNTLWGRAARTPTPAARSVAASLDVGHLHGDRVHPAAEALEESPHRRRRPERLADLDGVVADPGHAAAPFDAGVVASLSCSTRQPNSVCSGSSTSSYPAARAVAWNIQRTSPIARGCHVGRPGPRPGRKVPTE